MLAQKEYKRRLDKVCLNIHWALYKKYGVKEFERWYEHKVESVIENDIVKILWEVCIHVGRTSGARYCGYGKRIRINV